jgi:hypothetical protein
MKALISPLQENLVVQVEQNEFEVAKPLYWVDCPDTIVAYEYTYDGLNFVPYVPPAPTAEQNKQRATKLLYETDWTTIADVADPALSNPYLMNQSEFFAYRSQLRAIAVRPTAGALNWPIKPTEQWSS